MRISDLKRIDEKRGLLKRLAQTGKSLFSDDAMEERAVGIIADQWESGWRRFMKNAAAGQDATEKPQYEVQDKNGDWNIYGEVFFNYLVDQGIDKQIAKRIINKGNPELLKSPEKPIPINPKDDKFFKKYVRSLMNANALEINDPEGLLKKVGGAATQKEKRPELTPEETADEFYDEFTKWAEEAGYTLPNAKEAKELGEADEAVAVGTKVITPDVVKEWLKRGHLSQASETVAAVFYKLIDKPEYDVKTEAGLKELIKDIHFGMVRNFLYDDKNKKDRTAEDFQKLIDISIKHYEQVNDTQMITALRDSLKTHGPEKTFTDNQERLDKEVEFNLNQKTGEVGLDADRAQELEVTEEKTLKLDPEVREEAIKILMDKKIFMLAAPTEDDIFKKDFPTGPDIDATTAAVDALTEKDLEGKNPTNVKDVVTAVEEKKFFPPKDKPTDKESVKDVAVAIVNREVEKGADKQTAQVIVTDVIDDDPDITSATDTVDKDKAEEIEAEVDDKLEAESEAEPEEAEPEDEHKRISDIVGKNYFVRERLDPNNHQHMMYYYLADLLGAKKGEEVKDETKKEEKENEE